MMGIGKNVVIVLKSFTQKRSIFNKVKQCYNYKPRWSI